MLNLLLIQKKIKMKRVLKIVLQIVLVVVVVGLVYILYDNIMKPIRFNKAYSKRRAVVKEKLISIKNSQVAYLDKYHKFAGDFDTLINFIKADSIIFIKAEGTIPDSIYNNSKTISEAEGRAIELGIISRDTIKISARDSLFPANYDLDTLRYIPYTNTKKQFQYNAKKIKTMSNAVMPVFEVKVHNNSYLYGLDPQLLINLNDKARDNEKFPGLYIGSLTEVNTNGNWDD